MSEFIKQRDESRRSIIEHFGVPPVLLKQHTPATALELIDIQRVAYRVLLEYWEGYFETKK